MNHQQLVELVTREVLRILEGAEEKPAPAPGRILVLGDPSRLEKAVTEGRTVGTLEEYGHDGEIGRYDCVYITELADYRLCDIALGRDASPFTCAVLKALLGGKPVYLLESALCYRHFPCSSSSPLYQLYEGYLQKLQEYGVQVISGEQAAEQIPHQENFEYTKKIITGPEAEGLAKLGKKQIRFPAGTVVTPLAKDAFRAAKIEYSVGR